ncbi:hypothetical protein WH221_14200 [Chryseobacterium culicis]|uniref:Lipoprotein n=1 Tax=Chryseobacterium culicis TaxID=680127 RepID=A0A2S9CS00_CHRCI|nr:hypothetical protein [Chryseobacterium culicis]PRB83260.1 hypothetical protein CQ022_14165 [Chryseobacterium culicis]PRB89502.1 hypothetical protein CQ033_13060 [Chryseobacterium culicis]
MKTSFFTKILSPLCAALILALCLLSCTRCSEPPKEPVSNSYKKKLISYREGRVLFDEYTRTNHEILTKYRNGEPDSRWYWFSLEDMEGYIKYVKENAKKQKLKNPGIRIYMGKYPVNHPKNRMAKPEYAGYQTIFLVPTSQKRKRDNAMARTEATEENTDVPSIESMNMTNLAPPPKTLSGTMP